MEAYLIRHAHAGARTAGTRDRYRRLSEEGFGQARALVDFFAPRPLVHLMSSPATRCVQTVEPLAAAQGLEVVEDATLWEDGAVADLFGLLEEQRRIPDSDDHRVVLCTHGNLIPAVVEQLAYQGAKTSGRGCERASIWMIRSDGERWVEARYFTPRLGYRG